MASKPHHITVGANTWCTWTGCQAGRDIDDKAGRVTCGQPSGAAARKAAARLRPHFTPGAVRIVAGVCPHAGA